MFGKTESRLARMLVAMGLVGAFLLMPAQVGAGSRSDPEVNDPAGDTFDEELGQAASGAEVSNVDFVAIWFHEVGSDQYRITIRVADLTSPAEFRLLKTVHSYEVFFSTQGHSFKAVMFRDIASRSFGLMDVQGVQEDGAPRTDQGTATLTFSSASDEIRFTLPRTWSVETPEGTLTFDFGAGTTLTGIRGIAYDGIGDAMGCSPCGPIDRTAIGRDFVFGGGGGGGGGEECPPGQECAKALKEHACDFTEWHFLINQISDATLAPASIHVTWQNGDEADVPRLKFTGNVAHYSTSENLMSGVTSASATLYEGWSGQFNLSHGPCFLDPKVDRALPLQEPFDYVCVQAPETPTVCS